MSPKPSLSPLTPVSLFRRLVRHLRARIRRFWPADPAGFLAGQFVADAVAREYKLFVPAGCGGQRLPLLVMLHGCTQDPDDFARGTRMNELAQAQGFLVLYPAQPQRSNDAKCWNWFKPGDQRRGRGEPEALAALTRQVIADHGVDTDRVYVAGLSAGGAMAIILAHEYTDLFAAAGVHSGLPQGAAFDLISALHAMRAGPSLLRRLQFTGATPPVIVVHGDEDRTVNPINGQRVIDDVLQGLQRRNLHPKPHVDIATVPGGRDFTRVRYVTADGRVRAEHVEVHGSGHAWSGGSATGSFTDPSGPDASREMWRFFSGCRLTTQGESITA